MAAELGRRRACRKNRRDESSGSVVEDVTNLAALRLRDAILRDGSEAIAKRAEPVAEGAVFGGARRRTRRRHNRVMGAMAVKNRLGAIFIIGMPPIQAADRHHARDDQGKGRRKTAQMS